MPGGRLPTVTGRQAIGALPKAGYVIDRVVGSHHVLRRLENPARALTVPVHGKRDLKPGTLRAIIRQAGLTVDEFVQLL